MIISISGGDALARTLITGKLQKWYRKTLDIIPLCVNYHECKKVIIKKSTTIEDTITSLDKLKTTPIKHENPCKGIIMNRGSFLYWEK